MYRTKQDLTYASQVRFSANVVTAGAPATDLRVQYSTDQTTWTNLTGTSVNISTTGLKVSTFTNLPAGAKQDVFLRVAGIGNGSADPRFALMSLQIK